MSNTHEDIGHIYRSQPFSWNGMLQLSEDRVLASTATSYMSGEVFASSGSPTCNGFVHPTRVAQSSWQKRKKKKEDSKVRRWQQSLATVS